MAKPNLLIFSDCYIYGGSERLMSFLFKNEVINNNYNLTFAFRNHKDYKIGMKADFGTSSAKIFPVNLLSNETLFYTINKSNYNELIKRVLKTPFWVLKKIGIYSILNTIVFLRLLQKVKPEILHINNGGFPAAASCNLLVFVSEFFRVKKVIYQVNNQAQTATLFNRWRNQKISDLVSTFITSSNLAKNNLSNNAGMAIEKIQIVRNIVKLSSIKLRREEILSSFKLPQDTFMMVNVAFLSKRKGQIYLLKAIKMLLDKFSDKPDICLFLIGDGEEETMLREYCIKNNIDKYIYFLGYQSNYADYLNAANLVVFPSVSHEDLPLVIIESLMLGKCVLATSLAGISEVIENNNNGILVDPNVSLEGSLAAKIEFLISNPTEISKMAAHAKVSSKLFSEIIYGNTLDKIYKDAK